MTPPPRLRQCEECGRTLDESRLNVEATIHHGARHAVCFDRKECKRARRRGRKGKA